jgi:hypothetical protein
VQESAYRVNAKNWISPSEPVAGIEHRKKKSKIILPSAPQMRCQPRIAAIGLEEIAFDVGQSRVSKGMLYQFCPKGHVA